MPRRRFSFAGLFIALAYLSYVELINHPHGHNFGVIPPIAPAGSWLTYWVRGFNGASVDMRLLLFELNALVVAVPLFVLAVWLLIRSLLRHADHPDRATRQGFLTTLVLLVCLALHPATRELAVTLPSSVLHGYSMM